MGPSIFFSLELEFVLGNTNTFFCVLFSLFLHMLTGVYENRAQRNGS